MDKENIDFYKLFGLPEPPPFSTHVKIHIGDKNAQIGLIIQHSLQKHGFEVKLHKDGLLALEYLKTNHAHVVIEDENLPSVNAYDMLRELSEDPSYIRPAFIVVADSLDKNSAMLAVERGVDDILVRPVTEKLIFQKIVNAYKNFINPKNPEVVYEFAKMQMREGKYDKAFEIYSTLGEHTGKAARPFVGMARVQLAQGDLEKALENAKKGIERNANYVHAYSLCGEIYLKMGDMENSYANLKKAVLISPLNIARYEKCSEILLSQKRTAECIELLTIAVDAGIDHHFINQRLGSCYFSIKEYQKALKYLKQAVRLEPTNLSYANLLAICYRDSKDFEMAIQTYNKMLKNEPDNHLVLFNKSLTLIMCDKKADAEKILQRILRLHPTFEKAKEKLQELKTEKKS